MRIGISRNQFTVSEALSLYFLRKCDNEFEFQEIDGDDLSLFDLYLQDGNIYVNASRQGHEQKLAKAQSTLVAAVGRLKNDILRCIPATKLTCAGTAYALCCVKDLEKRVQAKFPKYTMKLLHMDIAHIYQATVEVVDAEYWRIALPSLTLELKHTNSQKEDFLIRVREISEMLPGGISDLEKEVVENGEENPATFHSIVADSIDLIGLEYEHIVDWFFNEWFDINTNCWIGLDFGYKIHYAGVIMFIQPTPINYYNWSVLEAYIKKLRDFEENAISLPMVVHLTETSAVKLVILKGTEIRATGQNVFNARPHSETGKPLYNLMYDVKELGSKCKTELEAMPQIYEQVSKSCGKNASNLYIRVHKSAMISFAHLRGLAMAELPSECSDFLSYINDALSNDYKANPYHQTNCVKHCKQELKIDAEGSRLIDHQSLVIMEESNSTLISQVCQITEKYVTCLEKNCDIAEYRNSSDSKMKDIFWDFSNTIHRYRMTSPACENVKEWASSAKCIDTAYNTWTGSEFAKPMYAIRFNVKELGEVCKAQLEIMPQIEERFSKSCGNNATVLFIRFYKNAMISFADLRGFKMAELPSECSDFLSYVNDNQLSNDYKSKLYYKIVHYVSSVFGLKKFLI